MTHTKPMKYHGLELHEHEEVNSVFRAQWARVVLLPSYIASLMVAGDFFLLGVLMRTRYVGPTLFWLCLASAILYTSICWVKWRGSALILTNQRILYVSRIGLLEKEVAEIPYTSLSDVSFRSKGVYEAISGAGTITFQMIGGKETVSFKRLADPSAVQKRVGELSREFKSGVVKRKDRVEEVLDTVDTLSGVEKRAVLASMKKKAPKNKEISDVM